MEFWTIYWKALPGLLIILTGLWLISVLITNVSIIDLFWGTGFLILALYFFWSAEGQSDRKLLITVLTAIWGLRLSIYLAIRNLGKGEDFRYQQFRKDYGEKNYWWISFFQVFVLQGLLIWLISTPILTANMGHQSLGTLDYLATGIWLVGFFFETIGDYQLSRFKSDPNNKGKVLNKGLWKFTRHPNYFGDTMVWWGYGCFSMAAGFYWPLLSVLLMTWLIIRVSGVMLLEKTLKNNKVGYQEYLENTSAFIPWFPKKTYG